MVSLGLGLLSLASIGCVVGQADIAADGARSARLRKTVEAKTIERKAKDDSSFWDAIDAILHGELMNGMSMPMSDAPSPIPNISDAPSDLVTLSPSPSVSDEPVSVAPSSVPSGTPAVVIAPTSTPVMPVSSLSPTVSTGTTELPTLTNCPGISEDERIEQILAILDSVANPDEIRDNSLPQGLATTWLLEQDAFQVCPSIETCEMIQRWSLAVIYYSTGGNGWFQCASDSDGNNPTDNCGSEVPFENDERFLSNNNECTWAGISCINGCVSEIEFELNNLAGTIPSEIGLLTGLEVWGMERGNLTGTIPTEVGVLTNLIFIDLDFNQLTGTLSSELLSLSSLTQLDLNDNKFSGSIDGVGVFPFMEFLQLHRNDFTGTVPEGVGQYTDMTAFTIHETFITGTIPSSICQLVATPGTASSGILTSLIADCEGPTPDIVCECCTDCRASTP